MFIKPNIVFWTKAVPFPKWGARGLSFRKYDLTVCAYCAGLTRLMLMAIARAWNRTPSTMWKCSRGRSCRHRRGEK